VQLSADGRPLTQKVVETSPAGAEVSFTFKPDKSGLVVYRVSLPELPGELTTRNNARDVALMVEEKPRSILLLAGRPSPESAFFKRALALDPRFKLTSQELRRKSETFKLSEDDLARHALVVACGYAREDFPPDGEARLASFVRRGQGSLVLLGVAPEEVESLYAGELGKLMPGVKPQVRVGEFKRLPLLLTPLGIRHPVTMVSSRTSASATRPSWMSASAFSIVRSTWIGAESFRGAGAEATSSAAAGAIQAMSRDQSSRGVRVFR
jgi:hypothetical protein